MPTTLNTIFAARAVNVYKENKRTSPILRDSVLDQTWWKKMFAKEVYIK